MNSIRLKEYYKKHSNIIHIILWIIFICWKIPFLNRGIDYTDTGFSMENYENVFFGNGIDSIGVFLTTYIGGLLFKLLPAYHLLVYRVLHWMIGLLSAFLAYRLFKRYLDKNLIMVLLLGLVFSSKGGEALFSYYPVTICLLIASLLLLHNGLVDNKKAKIFFAGLLSGVNIFARLPNLLFVVMALGIIYYGWMKKQDKKDVFRLVLLYASGVLTAVICFIPLIIAVMGADSLIDSLMGYVNLALGMTSNKVENVLGIQEKSGHSLTAIIKTLCIQGARAVVSFALYILPVVLVAEVVGWLVKKFCKAGNVVLKYKNIALAVYFIVMAFIIKGKVVGTLFFIIGLGSLLLSLIMLVKVHKKNHEYGLLFLLNLVIGCCSVFGSDLGFSRLGILSNFIILTACLAVKTLAHTDDGEAKIHQITLKHTAVYVLVCAYIVGIFCKLPVSYCDGDFSELDYSVNSEIRILRGMKTSEQRASQLEEYYDVMSADELEDYEAVIFGYFPLGFTIVNHTNYFEDVQPCIDYPSVSVESLLRVMNEKQEDNIKPLIVVSYVNQLQRGDDHFTSDAKEAVLEYMLELNEYETYYESENFLVYKPVE